MNPRSDARQEEDLGVLLVSASTRLNRLYGRVLAQLEISLLYESLAAVYDAATEVFQRPDPAIISAAGTARTAEN